MTIILARYLSDGSLDRSFGGGRTGAGRRRVRCAVPERGCGRPGQRPGRKQTLDQWFVRCAKSERSAWSVQGFTKLIGILLKTEALPFVSVPVREP
jgi:hypothetical protein